MGSLDARSGSANDSTSDMRFFNMNKNRIENELNKKIEQLKILESQAKNKYEDGQDSEEIEQASPRIAIN